MDPLKLIEQINASIESMKADNKAAVEALRAANESTGAEAKQALQVANEAATRVAASATSLVELEQKLAEGVQRGKARPETLGQIIIKSEQFKEYAKGGIQKMRVEANTIIGQDGGGDSDNTLVPAQRLQGIIPGAFRALRVADVLPRGTTISNAIEYARELAFTNNAAETAEAAAKPESALTFELATAPVRTIATFLKASRQVLDDAPALASYIDTRLRYAIEYRLDNQLLNGNGTGQNISGMLDTGNYTPFTPQAGENALDAVNRAIYDVLAADYSATAVIMNPSDWGAIERIKRGSDDNAYVVGNPLGSIQPVLWGLPVVVTNAMAAGQFITGAFDMAYQLWMRQGSTVEVFEQDVDNVQKNLLTIRAELRAALAVYRAASVQAGALVATAS